MPVVVVTAKDLTRDELIWLRTNAEEVFQKGSRRELIAVVPEGDTGRAGRPASWRRRRGERVRDGPEQELVLRPRHGAP